MQVNSKNIKIRPEVAGQRSRPLGTHRATRGKQDSGANIWHHLWGWARMSQWIEDRGQAATPSKEA